MTQHVPVLLEELLALLQPTANQHFIDATLGGAGMAHAFLDHTKPNGVVVGIEQDVAAIKNVKKHERLHIVQGNFRNILELTSEYDQIDGIYFDLGISSDQLLRKGGISFQDPNAPLDMRMNTKEGFTAADLLNSAAEKDIVNILSAYGEERKSKTVAREIIKARTVKPFATVEDLLNVVQVVYPKKYYKKHPGTQIWQALRIAVNDELDAIEEALPKAFEKLSSGGRVAVISVHSLEDRIVKNYFKTITKEGKAKLLNKKIIIPTDKELKINPRARSAKLRGIEKK